MKRKIYPGVIMPFVLLFAGQLHSQSVQKLNISQAVQLGVANSSQLKLDSARLEQSRLKQVQASDYALPDVRVNASYSRLSNITPLAFQFPGNPEPVTLMPNVPNAYALSASVRQNVFAGWKLKYTQESYGYLTQAAQLDVQKDRDEVQFNIISAYLSFVRLQLARQIVNENLEASGQRVQEVTAQRDRGLATENDVLKAQLYRSNIELSKKDIDNSIAIAQFNLCILLGFPSGTGIDADTSGITAAISLLTEQAYEQQALASRSDMKAADYRVQASESNIHVAQSAFYPTLSVGANYLDARPNQRIFPLTDEFRSTWDVGVTLSWSVTALYTAHHVVEDAQVQSLQAHTQAGMLNDNVRMEVFQSYTLCQGALDKITMLELAVAQAQENSRQMNAKFNQQAALMSDVLDADAALLQARINLAMQRVDARIAYYRLQKSTGTLQ
jgi:outer membrane protein TolC